MSKMDREKRAQMVRSIEAVEDVDELEPDRRFQSAKSILDPLSAPMLSELRHEVRNRYDDRNPRFLCGECGNPVYVSLSGAFQTSDRDGRDAFFAHHPGTAEVCKWGTGGKNPRDIDGLKYAGVSEGDLHRRLKMILANMLDVDPAFSNVQVEEVISRPPDWRKPDVMASFLNGIVAFDLQLATTQLPAIVARERFYEQNGIRYVWVTSTDDSRKLALQSFQDTYWKNGGQIFGVDTHAETISLQNKKLYLKALTVMPRFDARGLRSVWERCLVDRDKINWNIPSGRPRFLGADYDAAFRSLVENRFADPRRRLILAVQRPKEDVTPSSEIIAYKLAGNAWDEIARKVGAPLWTSAEQDQAFKAIGVLASAAAGKKMDYSNYDNLVSIFNNMLEPRTSRGWTSALIGIAEAHGHTQLLSSDSTQRKIQRNLEEGHPDLSRKYTAILDILFPKSARSRVSGPPSEIEDV